MIGGPASDRPRIALDVDELRFLAQVLTQIDEFLRTGDHVDHYLADFLSTGPGDTGQTAAYCLIDIVSFTAYSYRRKADAAMAAARLPYELIQTLPDTLQETDEEIE
jgi:hypothetical protein